jgi:hypothetical protein
VQITDRDRELLAFLAEHRLVVGDHVRALLGISSDAASARLRALTGAGYVGRVSSSFHRGPTGYQITSKGLRVIGSDLPRPRTDERGEAHDAGVAWVWLAARAGAFGPLREVVSERRMRSHDRTEDGRQEPFAVRLGGVGPRGWERLHYPDLLLVTAEGKRVAVELELSRKGRVRREKILAGYGADRRIDAVLYLVGDRAIARDIGGSARKLGISERVQIQPVRWAVANDSAGPELSRTAQRGRGEARSPRAAMEASR